MRYIYYSSCFDSQPYMAFAALFNGLFFNCRSLRKNQPCKNKLQMAFWSLNYHKRIKQIISSCSKSVYDRCMHGYALTEAMHALLGAVLPIGAAQLQRKK